MKKISSWGKVKPVKYQKFTTLKGQNYIKSDITEGSLVFGNGRSYGDVCFAEDTVIFSNEFNRILSIDKNKGIVSCQSGLLLHDLFKKIIPEAPHETMLVLDGGTGQNAFMQAKLFAEATAISGLILTKLDGTAKGGVVIGISDELDVPIRYIGVGEGIDDLIPFETKAFLDSLFQKTSP